MSSVGRLSHNAAATTMLPPCRICNEKASGFHYGVNTCEACKAFFRRSLKKCSIYKCADNDACEIGPGKRSSCAFCRFQKCLALGMCKDAIKTGRYTHEKRARNIKEVKGIIDHESHRSPTVLIVEDKMDQSDDSLALTSNFSFSAMIFSGSPSVQASLSVSTLNSLDSENPSSPLFYLHNKDNKEVLESIINHIVEVHKTQATYSEEVFDAMPQKENEYLEQLDLKRQVFGKMESMSRDEYLYFYNETGIDLDGRIELLETHFLPHIEMSIKRFIRFVKAIPGFVDLTVDDQIALIKSSRFDFWMILFHRCFNPERKLYLTMTGKILSSEEMLKLNDLDLIDEIFKMQARIKQLKLNLEETCIFAAFVVMFTDHCPLKNREIVEHSQEQLLSCLGYLFNKYHADDRTRFTDVINCLLHLRSVREAHHKSEERFAKDWQGIINFPPLLYEMWSS